MDRLTILVIVELVYISVNVCVGYRRRPLLGHSVVNYPIRKSFNWADNEPYQRSTRLPPQVRVKYRPRPLGGIVNQRVFRPQNYYKQRPQQMTTRRPTRAGDWIATQLPIFEESGEDDTSFTIYRGHKAQLIFNTVMGGRPYKMLEPIPGQVIHPPVVPTYKPGSFSKSYTNSLKNQPTPPSYTSKKDLVPFYAHEAVFGWPLQLAGSNLANHVVQQQFKDSLHPENLTNENPGGSQAPGTTVIYAIPYSKYVAKYGNLSNYGELGHPHSQQMSATRAPDKMTTNQQINNQIGSPSFFSRVPSTTPMSPGKQASTYSVSGYMTPTTFPDFTSLGLKTKKKRIVYHAKNAGFKSYLPLPFPSLKKAITKHKYANYGKRNKTPNHLDIRNLDPALINHLEE